MSTNDQYSLNWSNHTSHIKRAFDSLWSGNQFVDVTLSCEGKKITAHKMLLSACSVYFYDLFRDNPCQHPIVILRDVKFNNLVNILKFIYSGEVNVPMETFDEFLKTAKLLQISGLVDEETRNSLKEKDEKIITTRNLPKLETQKQVSVNNTNVETVKEKETTRKRPSDVNSVNEVSEKRPKDSELNVDVAIKQERDVEDDHFVDIKDPLDLEEEHADPTDTDVLQAAPSQKFVDVQDFLNDEQSSKKSLSSVKEEAHSSFSNSAPPNSVQYVPICYPPLVITHMPTQIPSTQKKQYPTRNCRYCPGRKETRWQCVPCGNVPLHRENCFEIYHNKLLYN